MKNWILRITAFVCLVSGGFLLADGCWIKAKAVIAQILLQHAWEETLVTGEPTKAWPWADTWPVARLQVERLGVDMIVLEGESGEVLAFGPGHLPASSTPGSGGHCILAGHRDTSFHFLQDLLAGDTITIQGEDRIHHTYRVQATQVLEAEQLYLRESTIPRLSLLTCYPFDVLQASTGLRYIVLAEKES